MQLRQQKAAGTTENSFQQLHKAQGSSFPRPSACVEVADPSFQGSSQGLRYQLPVISSPGSRSREQWCLGPQTWCRVTQPAPTGTSEGLIKAKRRLVEGFSSTALCRGLPHPLLWFDSHRLPTRCLLPPIPLWARAQIWPGRLSDPTFHRKNGSQRHLEHLRKNQHQFLTSP